MPGAAGGPELPPARETSSPATPTDTALVVLELNDEASEDSSEGVELGLGLGEDSSEGLGGCSVCV